MKMVTFPRNLVIKKKKNQKGDSRIKLLIVCKEIFLERETCVGDESHLSGEGS